MTHDDVLRLKHAVRERDGFACTECGMTAADHIEKFGRDIEVHRLNPGSNYTMEGCITVCRPCHHTMPKSPRGSLPKKPGRVVVIPPAIGDLIAHLADYRCSSVTRVVKDACVAYLRAEGLWQPATPVRAMEPAGGSCPPW